jgi:putative YphP/YqiW family bacilliredoxin
MVQGGSIMAYESLLVQPMRQDLVRIGVLELRTAAEVDTFLANRQGTVLLFVNSVCGCAADQARPALALALRNRTRPDRLAFVFAGPEPEATARARGHFPEFPPSSPSLFLIKEGDVVLHIPRGAIERRNAKELAEDLIQAFNVYCARERV